MSAPTRARFTDDELEDVRQRELVSAIFDRFGARPRRAGRMYVCLCPWHPENTPSCQINDSKGVFHCKGCTLSGDVFKAVQLFRGCSFPEAVEFLGGTRELSPEDRERMARQAAERKAREEAAERRARSWAEQTWREGRRIARGDAAYEYLAARGIAAPPEAELRFVPALPYYGFPDASADEGRELGTFPAMLGAIRDGAGKLIGVHRTYIAADRPAKLKPPGCPLRNRAKKITGQQMGGSIALSAPSERMVYGEGIETTLSFGVLEDARAAGFGMAALVSLGNIAGSALGSLEHPTLRHDNGRPVTIPNGQPDPEKPGFIPGPGVRLALLLGDGDSDPASTRANLLTGLRRWRAAAHERGAAFAASVRMADAGADFNDMLLARDE